MAQVMLASSQGVRGKTRKRKKKGKKQKRQILYKQTPDQPPPRPLCYQSFQVDTEGLKLNEGHFVRDNFKHLAPNPDA